MLTQPRALAMIEGYGALYYAKNGVVNGVVISTARMSDFQSECVGSNLAYLTTQRREK